MTIKIDRAGRIVLPKPVRDRLGLRGGMNLEMTESSGELVLKPLTHRPSMVRVNGFWVHQGVAPKGFDWNQFTEEQRQERHRMILGL
jgi:AbrB family looped-hinge helix DNA binding protein